MPLGWARIQCECCHYWALRVALVGKIPPAGGFDPWVRKIPWRRKWQPTPVFLPGEYRGLRSLVGYSPQGRKELDTTVRLHFYIYLKTCQFENKVRQTYFLHHTIHSKPLPCEEKYTILVYW